MGVALALSLWPFGGRKFGDKAGGWRVCVSLGARQWRVLVFACASVWPAGGSEGRPLGLLEGQTAGSEFKTGAKRRLRMDGGGAESETGS